MLLSLFDKLRDQTLAKYKLLELTQIFKNIIRHLSLLSPTGVPDEKDKEVMAIMADILTIQVSRRAKREAERSRETPGDKTCH